MSINATMSEQAIRDFVLIAIQKNLKGFTLYDQKTCIKRLKDFLKPVIFGKEFILSQSPIWFYENDRYAAIGKSRPPFVNIAIEEMLPNIKRETEEFNFYASMIEYFLRFQIHAFFKFGHFAEETNIFSKVDTGKVISKKMKPAEFFTGPFTKIPSKGFGGVALNIFQMAFGLHDCFVLSYSQDGILSMLAYRENGNLRPLSLEGFFKSSKKQKEEKNELVESSLRKKEVPKKKKK